MLRMSALALLCAGCSLFPDLSGLSSDAGASDATTPDSTTKDAGTDSSVDAPPEATADAADAGCSCTSLVSAYLFANANDLGRDFFGNNDFVTVHGAPKQSTATPNGLPGYSIQLDGSSTVCIDTGFTFDSTSDHTLCWWSMPTALASSTNQFAQACSYDTWTQSSGVDYLWRINNCNTGTPANLVVPNVFSVGKWVGICQTYVKSTLTRSVVIDGQTGAKTTQVDAVPIVENTSNWCIGSYGSGGFWTGLIYRPLWFNRVLSDAEIQMVNATACCLQ